MNDFQRGATFKGINWGDDDARNDANLHKYFVGKSILDSVVLGKYRYVVGRKGTGKTALLERIRIAARSEYPRTWRVADLSLRSFPLQLVRDLRDKSYRDKSQFVPVWTFVMAVELAHLVVSDPDAAESSAGTALKQFLNQNFDPTIRGFADTLQRLRERSGQVQLPANMVLGAKDSTQTVTTRNHWDAARHVLRLLADVPSKSSYFVLIDELDEGFRAGDTGLRLLLLALLRAAEDTQAALKAAAPHFRVVVALRDDIFDSLEDADLNKLDDYVLRLHWASDAAVRSDDSALSLRGLAGARIAASREASPARDSWPTVVLDDDPKLPSGVASIWSYMLNRTYERPRDLVKFLKLCDKTAPRSGPLRYDQVCRAEVDYSDWLYRELRDEIQSFLPVWKEAFQAISQINCGVASTRDLRAQLENQKEIALWLRTNSKTVDDVLKLMFEYGVIGSYTSKRVWSFRYKDPALAWDPRAANIIVHWGLVRKLRLVRMLASEDVATPWQSDAAELGR